MKTHTATDIDTQMLTSTHTQTDRQTNRQTQKNKGRWHYIDTQTDVSKQTQMGRQTYTHKRTHTLTEIRTWKSTSPYAQTCMGRTDEHTHRRNSFK